MTTSLHRIALVGTHTPRLCGIATFTSDLADALAAAEPRADVVVAAMDDPGRRYAYPPRVTATIAEDDRASYPRAAQAIARSGADCVSLQHEYGIFGGPAGSDVLALVRDIGVPVITTLHTLLTAPTAAQRAVMDELTRLSSRVVVMSAGAAAILRGVHGVDPAKIDVIPHGIPAAPLPEPNKSDLGLAGRSVVLTYGLLSPGKGIEAVIDALPAIRARDPSVAYVVLGTTHPHERDQHGERYRQSLVARAKSLGVDACVLFRDKFATQAELASYLAAADVYVTAYTEPAQISSGTLAYALGAGKAVVATPYRYARELLAEGRGVLVPFGDSAQLGQAISGLLAAPALRAGLSTRGLALGAEMRWPVVASRYVEVFEAAVRARGGGPTRGPTWAELPAVTLDHVAALTDSTGILQHALYDVPCYEDGYCLDDNARALLLTTWLDERDGLGTDAMSLQDRYLAFVAHAFVRGSGRFRNFMTYARRFREEVGSEDCHGRALWALGAMVLRGERAGPRRLARDLFLAGLPATLGFGSPRARAYTLLGLDAYLAMIDGDTEAMQARAVLARGLLDQLERARMLEWPWFEDRLTYANARLPQALVVSGLALRDEPMIGAGLHALRWLTARQDEAGVFVPIGAPEFQLRAGPKPRFDQQPIEAGCTVSACLAAERATGDAHWRAHARTALGWFLGRNVLHQALYDPSSGGCRDGLHPTRPNENQGAESTLSFQLALAEMRAVTGATGRGAA
jgi:glycosyltransferase involved in cell wall biosynthesis